MQPTLNYTPRSLIHACHDVLAVYITCNIKGSILDIGLTPSVKS